MTYTDKSTVSSEPARLLFMAIPEVEIDGYTLDEPDYEVKENRARRKNNKKD